jgi:hypothetical protein
MTASVGGTGSGETGLVSKGTGLFTNIGRSIFEGDAGHVNAMKPPTARIPARLARIQIRQYPLLEIRPTSNRFFVRGQATARPTCFSVTATGNPQQEQVMWPFMDPSPTVRCGSARELQRSSRRGVGKFALSISVMPRKNTRSLRSEVTA